MQPTPHPRSSGRTVVKQGPSPAKLLASVPRRPMSPEQQLEAVNKVQQQADHRIKLGQQLFKAAEARLSQHHDLLEQVRAEQAALRERVQDDVAQSLQSYDQWMGRIDEGFTKALERLGDRIDQTERDLAESRGEMQQMLAQVSAMMEQTQRLLSEAFGEEPDLPTDPPAVTSLGVHIDTPKPEPESRPDADVKPEHAHDDDSDIFGHLLDQLRSQRDDDVAA
ncbi:MAG: hypothetical protein ACIAXF_13955 [Phycisphaerales bacterium JB063]